MSGRDEARIACEIKVKKSEKKFIEAIAVEKFGPCRSGKPAVGRAMVYLLRVAFNCFREHTEKYQEEIDLDPDDIAESGLHITKNPNNAGQIRTIHKNGRVEYD